MQNENGYKKGYKGMQNDKKKKAQKFAKQL